jgi:hypothetical protein
MTTTWCPPRFGLMAVAPTASTPHVAFRIHWLQEDFVVEVSAPPDSRAIDLLQGALAIVRARSACMKVTDVTRAILACNGRVLCSSDCVRPGGGTLRVLLKPVDVC